MSEPNGRGGRPRGADAPGGVRTLERGLSVLWALATLREAPLSQVARAAGLSASTAYRLLETLRQQGFVEWEEASGLFRVGLRAYQVGAAFDAAHALTAAAAPEMRALVAELGESANLAVLRPHGAGLEAAYVHQVEGPQLVRMFTQTGASAPLHASGVGKVLLAARPEAEARRALEATTLTAYTSHTLTTVDAALAAVARVRGEGFALDDQERELGVRCVAVPVPGADGQVAAALSVSAPTSRLTPEQVPRFLAAAQAAASRIAVRLGHRDA
ncbi:IclR family transcriptional regulator [Deinococcus grandis]|uniref:IclR family transcriptional regulator n=1 Tax=Deinococcus grandis TaxID=57498 RepID=A0A117DPG0_9DEIO|nr:IclR family transcriptional regulator [Deinococcus grandis]BBN96646.1 transcriptional regulator [Deinococcus grandis]GAQ23386.1 IclR family transcriptional regulator [Deinococcus grandis]